MDARLKELFDGYLALSQEDLVEIVAGSAKKLYDAALPYFDRNEDEAFRFVVLAAGTFISVDAETSVEEYAIFKALFGKESMTPEDFMNIIKNSYDVDLMKAIDGIVDQADGAVKENLLRMGLALCAIDGKVTEEEASLFAIYLQ